MSIIPTGSPNVWAWSWWADDGLNDVQYTVYRLAPGDTLPRLAMSNYNRSNASPVHVDCGVIEEPARFGTWDTPEAFEQFVRKFINEEEEEL